VKSRFGIVVLLCVLLTTGPGAVARVASAEGGPAHPSFIRADQPQGAGIPAPTPTPVATPIPVIEVGLRVRMPELGINLQIVEGRGLEPDYGLADHYPGMKWPGQGGRSFIYAHAQPGMFGPLLASGGVGQHVEIVEPDGHVLHYTIQQFTRNWPVTDVSILAPTDHEELVLYTCTSWTYSDPKVVAIAEPDPGS
jgi:sortase (surface protein transpeptidase)